jgi:hypothetical protein
MSGDNRCPLFFYQSSMGTFLYCLSVSVVRLESLPSLWNRNDREAALPEAVAS